MPSAGTWRPPRGLPVRRVGRPGRPVDGAWQRRPQPGGQARVRDGERLRRRVVIRGSLVPQRGRADHQVADRQPLVDRAGGADADEQFRPPRGQLLDRDRGRRRADRQPGEAQLRRQPQQRARADRVTVQLLVLAAFPHPPLEACLPGEHDRPGRREKRGAERFVIVEQPPRRHVRPTAVLPLEVRKWHPAMIAAPVAPARIVLAARLVPARKAVAPVHCRLTDIRPLM